MQDYGHSSGVRLQHFIFGFDAEGYVTFHCAAPGCTLGKVKNVCFATDKELDELWKGIYTGDQHKSPVLTGFQFKLKDHLDYNKMDRITVSDLKLVPCEITRGKTPRRRTKERTKRAEPKMMPMRSYLKAPTRESPRPPTSPIKPRVAAAAPRPLVAAPPPAPAPAPAAKPYVPQYEPKGLEPFSVLDDNPFGDLIDPPFSPPFKLEYDHSYMEENYPSRPLEMQVKQEASAPTREHMDAPVIFDAAKELREEGLRMISADPYTYPTEEDRERAYNEIYSMFPFPTTEVADLVDAQSPIGKATTITTTTTTASSPSTLDGMELTDDSKSSRNFLFDVKQEPHSIKREREECEQEEDGHCAKKSRRFYAEEFMVGILQKMADTERLRLEDARDERLVRRQELELRAAEQRINYETQCALLQHIQHLTSKLNVGT